MAINPDLIEIKKVSELDDLALALENFFAHCKPNGILGKINIQGLVNFITPYVASIGASGYVSVSGTVLPNSTLLTSAFTLVPKGTFTQTTGGNVVTTSDITILSWNGTVWSIASPVNINLSDYILKSDLVYDKNRLNFQAYIKQNTALTSGGAEVVGTGYVIVSKFPVSSLTPYMIEGMAVVAGTKFIAEYNISNVLVLGTNKELTTTSLRVDTTSTTKFLSWTLKAPSEPDNSSVTNARAYGIDLTKIVAFKDSNFKDPSLTLQVSDFVVKSISLIPYIASNTAITSGGAIVTGAGYTSVLKIPVDTGQKYIINSINPSIINTKQLVQYNSVGAIVLVTQLLTIPHIFIPEATTKTISFTLVDSTEVDGYSLSNGYFGAITKFVSDSVKSKWFGKIGVSFGDSITWYDGNAFNASHSQTPQIAVGYQSYIRKMLGCKVINQGVSGYDMTQIRPLIAAYNFTTIDFVTITSGANDARKGILPGTVLPIGSTFNTGQYAGAMQSAIEYVIGNNKACKIYLIAPINGWFNESGTVDVPGPYNGEMFISRAYVDVIVAIGKLYAIPVCNLYDNSFINSLNRTLYIGDAGSPPYYLHPTQEGFKLIGEKVVSFIMDN